MTESYTIILAIIGGFRLAELFLTGINKTIEWSMKK